MEILMKKSILTFISLSLILGITFSGCSKKKESKEASPEVQPVQKKESTTTSSNADLTLAGYTYEESLKTSGFHTEAHKKYLNDPLKFKSIPTQNLHWERQTFVVASDFAMLYSQSNFNFTEHGWATIKDPDNMIGEPIPYATLLKGTGSYISNSDPELNSYCQGMFNFQDNWNWFFEVEYNGKTGYVFGSDLYGRYNSYESNCISAELYRTNGKFQEFYPITGYTPIQPDIVQSLEKDKLAIQYAEPEKTYYIDDMLHEYNSLRWGDRNRSLFITTDLASHCQHLTFDRMIQYTEENYFAPRLLSLTQNFIEKIKIDDDVHDDLKNIALTYFQIPEALLRITETKPQLGEYEADEESPDVSEVLSEYPTEVAQIVRKILAADSIDSITCLGDDPIKEDFSQYKPRGHYTKNKALESYFRAEMWYGRIHFLIAKPQINKNSKQQLERTAFYLINLVQKNPELYNAWEEVFTPITDLIGYSDDLGFEELLPLWKELGSSNFKDWSAKKSNIAHLMKACNERLRPPAISGTSFTQGGTTDSEDASKPAMGFRFLGQRFTWDSYIHQKVSPPRLMSRDMVRGLDIMKAFGSRTADWLLQQYDYPSMPGLEDKLNEIQGDFEKQPDNFWNKTYYNTVLAQIKALATFEQGAGFYFTESPLWNIKSMLSSHGTWAELRHDTILYVKQSCAERAGDGDFEPTFRTKPLPKPINYIEPNLPFWQISKNSVLKLQKIYSNYNLMDSETENTLEMLLNLYDKCIEIVKLEADDKPISEEQNEWIRTVPDTFNITIMIHNRNGYIDDIEQNKMACIADVYTNGEKGLCLEVGTGRPHRIYVPLNDGQGGKRIATGIIYSYYEFSQSQTNRLNDEEWKTEVYTSPDACSEKMPDWERKILRPYTPDLQRYR